MTDKPEIKPCPFCGGEIFSRITDSKHKGYYPIVCIKCYQCEATGPSIHADTSGSGVSSHESIQEALIKAVDAWNARQEQDDE